MHTAIIVRDLYEARRYYKELGFEVGDCFDLKSIGVKLTYVVRDGLEIELIEGDSEPHVCIEVPSVEEWLAEHDVQVVKNIYIAEWGKRAIFFRGINGELIEVIEE